MAQGEGPLAGIKVVEFAGLGPAPFCGMLLSDLGADVIRIDRQDGEYKPWEVITRGRKSVALNLKQAEAVDVALRLIDSADMLLEGFRPGVMERLGLGPDVVLSRRPALVYGRMTGWGQTGSRAKEAGHDINYIAAAGALHGIGPAEKPVIPLNLVGDFGGGALYLAFGVLAALIQARSTGKGQVVDCAMVDGTASLMAMIYGRLSGGIWQDRRASNTIDGAAHWYNTYECADGKWFAVGAYEKKFYDNLIAAMGFPDPETFDTQQDRARWPELRARFAEQFKTRTQAEWIDILGRTETCSSAILSMEEAVAAPENVERNLFSTLEGVLHVSPAPRFSASPDLQPGRISMVGEGQDAHLAAWGFSEGEIADLHEEGVLKPL